MENFHVLEPPALLLYCKLQSKWWRKTDLQTPASTVWCPQARISMHDAQEHVLGSIIVTETKKETNVCDELLVDSIRPKSFMSTPIDVACQYNSTVQDSTLLFEQFLIVYSCKQRAIFHANLHHSAIYGLQCTRKTGKSFVYIPYTPAISLGNREWTLLDTWFVIVLQCKSRRFYTKW